MSLSARLDTTSIRMEDGVQLYHVHKPFFQSTTSDVLRNEVDKIFRAMD